MRKKLLAITATLVLVVCAACGNQRETQTTTLTTAEYGQLLNTRTTSEQLRRHIVGTWELRGFVDESRTCQRWVGGKPNGTATFNEDGTYTFEPCNGEAATTGKWLLDDHQNPDVFEFRGERCLSVFDESGRTMYIRKVADGFFVLYERVNNNNTQEQ